MFFAGSLELCNQLVTFDLCTLMFDSPRQHGRRPLGRLSPTVVAVPGQLLVYGGFAIQSFPGELGDLLRLQLLPDELLVSPSCTAGAGASASAAGALSGARSPPGGGMDRYGHLLPAFLRARLLVGADDGDSEEEGEEDDSSDYSDAM